MLTEFVNCYGFVTKYNIKDLYMQDDENTEICDLNENESTRNNLKILYIGELLDCKGDKLIRIKRKIYDEIMQMRDDDHTKINNTINSILASFLFDSKDKD